MRGTLSKALGSGLSIDLFRIRQFLVLSELQSLTSTVRLQ